MHSTGGCRDAQLLKLGIIQVKLAQYIVKNHEIFEKLKTA